MVLGEWRIGHWVIVSVGEHKMPILSEFNCIRTSLNTCRIQFWNTRSGHQRIRCTPRIHNIYTHINMFSLYILRQDTRALAFCAALGGCVIMIFAATHYTMRSSMFRMLANMCIVDYGYVDIAIYIVSIAGIWLCTRVQNIGEELWASDVHLVWATPNM